MLIVTADDYGRERHATDSILLCGARGRVTSASAMVFMQDSKRAADLAADSPMEFGLHLNFTEPLNGANVPGLLRFHHDRTRRFLSLHRLAPVLYNPGLQQSFRIVFEEQRDEYEKQYGVLPHFYNGHHHMHLSANVLLGGLIPGSSRIRNTFTFEVGERSPFNRVYRGWLRRWIRARYTTTDSFYAMAPAHDLGRIRSLITRSHTEVVELETHPEDAAEAGLLQSVQYDELLKDAQLGSFRDIDAVTRRRQDSLCG